MLISTNPNCEDIIFSRARQKFGRSAMPLYEHGQWWVIVERITEDAQEIYSVIDTSDGIQFEMV